MNILVVNDDGYTSEGIKILADAFKERGNVYVVAPHTGKSGAGSSITVGGGLTVHQQGKQSWSVEGTPTDCVKFALFGLKLDVDLVVSGINNGYNLGIDTIYSGTIGATMEALFHGKKAIAFSTKYEQFEIAKEEIESVIDYVYQFDLLSDEYLLNINFTPTKSKGIEVTDLAIRGFVVDYTEKENQMYSTRTFVPYEYKKGTDLWAMHHGYISITPLKLGNGDRKIVDHLKSKIK